MTHAMLGDIRSLQAGSVVNHWLEMKQRLSDPSKCEVEAEEDFQQRHIDITAQIILRKQKSDKVAITVP